MNRDLVAAAAIGESLARLAVARAGLLDDVTAEVYIDRLLQRQATPDLVRRACAELADTPRKPKETALPDVGKIIETIESIAHADRLAEAAKKLLPMPQDGDREPTYFCTDCFDEPGAWRLFWCQGAGQARVLDTPPQADRMTLSYCGRRFAHAPHSYAERCACREVNPVIARHREKQASARAARGAR